MSRNHLTILAAAATAALAFATAPAFAQTNYAPPVAKPAATDAGAAAAKGTAGMGTMDQGSMGDMHGHRHAARMRGMSHMARNQGAGRASSADHSADQLNAQSLAAIQGNGGMATGGATGGAAGGMQPGGGMTHDMSSGASSATHPNVGRQ